MSTRCRQRADGSVSAASRFAKIEFALYIRFDRTNPRPVRSPDVEAGARPIRQAGT
jgi:hypothetical protein